MKRKIVVGSHTTFKKWCAANSRNPTEYINVPNATSAAGYTANGDVSESLIILYDFDQQAVNVLEAHGFTQKQLAQKGCERDTDGDGNCDRHPNGCRKPANAKLCSGANNP